MSDAIEFKVRIWPQATLYACTCGATYYDPGELYFSYDPPHSAGPFCAKCPGGKPADALQWSGYNARFNVEDGE